MQQKSNDLKQAGPAALTIQPDELATELRVGRGAIYRGLREGTIPSVRIGKRFIIPRSAVTEWLKTAGSAISA